MHSCKVNEYTQSSVEIGASASMGEFGVWSRFCEVKKCYSGKEEEKYFITKSQLGKNKNKCLKWPWYKNKKEN